MSKWPEDYIDPTGFWAPCDECQAVRLVKWYDKPGETARRLLCETCKCHARPTGYDEPSPLFVASLFVFLAGLGVLLGVCVHFAQSAR